MTSVAFNSFVSVMTTFIALGSNSSRTKSRVSALSRGKGRLIGAFSQRQNSKSPIIFFLMDTAAVSESSGVTGPIRSN